MTWADFYLGCFLVGLALTGVSLLTGHVHLPHAHGLGHAPHGHAGEVSVINFGTVTAFLAWFGGAGYLLTRYYGVWRWLGLGAAIVTGLV